MLPPRLRHTPRRRRPTLRVLAASLVAAAVFHGLLWTIADTHIGRSDALPASAGIRVRTLPATAQAPDLATTETVPPAQPVPRKMPPRTATSAQTATAVTGPVVAHAPTAAESAVIGDQADTSVDADLVHKVASTGDVTVPTYRTLMPPSAVLSYDLRKGFFSGSGQLVWKPAGDRYEVRLEGSVAGMNLLTQTSVGQLDSHGISPTRYTDVRTRRGVNAANFQRDKGKITYSGPQVEYPLLPGTQDRVSWMVQIAAILNADPRLARSDGRIVMFVSGANGDADVWVFRFEGTEMLRTDSGPVHAVKFTREPRKAYDRAVEVWLAPARHHLPIRARFTASAGADAFELVLRDMHLP